MVMQKGAKTWALESDTPRLLSALPLISCVTLRAFFYSSDATFPPLCCGENEVGVGIQRTSILPETY